MTKKRVQYTYQLIGLINAKKLRKKSKYQQYFYQLNTLLENKPEITKIFAFKAKLTNSQIWEALEQNNFLGKKYLFTCRNYQGSYYLVNWEEVKDE